MRHVIINRGSLHHSKVTDGKEPPRRRPRSFPLAAADDDDDDVLPADGRSRRRRHAVSRKETTVVSRLTAKTKEQVVTEENGGSIGALPKRREGNRGPNTASCGAPTRARTHTTTQQNRSVRRRR